MREAWLFCNGSWKSLGRVADNYHLLAHLNATRSWEHGWVLGLRKRDQGDPPMSTAIYFRSLAARCRTSARHCSDHFAKEEFHRLAHEFQIRADQLEGPAPSAEPGWLPSKPGQARGFAGER
jgi:hypothetical protein